MATLYVVGVPTGDPDHLTLRARRILAEAHHVLAEDVPAARALLAHHGIAAQPAAISGDGGGVVALVVEGWPGEAGRRLVQAAAGQGYDVAAVPGPALPVTALILSGLPADTFLYLGQVPSEAAARRRRLAAAANRPYTLVALAGPPLDEILADLHQVLGDRPLAVVPASGLDSRNIWRGSLAAAVEREEPGSGEEVYALVIGGAPAEPERWDEARLVDEIEARLARGRRAKEISRQLSDLSGWSRREVYDLVIRRVSAGDEATRRHTNNE
ncbi:MAG: SAM-dependent methyltransferase [Anaerolineae bacterium]